MCECAFFLIIIAMTLSKVYTYNSKGIVKDLTGKFLINLNMFQQNTNISFFSVVQDDQEYQR